MSSFFWPPTGGSGSGANTYPNTGAFPAASVAGNGALAIDLSSDILYESNGTSWLPIASNATYALTAAATSLNTPSTLVERDGSGNFAAGAITASLTGHASLDVLTSAVGAANGVAPLDSSGLVPLANIPPAAIERMVVVANQTARFALTTATVQNGDTVYQNDTQVMYFVIDQNNLNNSAGYQVYSAGTTVNFSGSLSGDVTGTQSATVVGKINGTSLAGLGTGILKNTTSTGVPSIAIAADFPTLNQSTTGTAANVTGIVAIANGGTNATSYTAPVGTVNPLLFYDGTKVNTDTGTTILGYDSTNDLLQTTAIRIYDTTTQTAKFTNTNATQNSTSGAGMSGLSDPGAAMASGSRLGFFTLGGATDAIHTTANSLSVEGFTTQAWTAANNGSKLVLSTTPNNSTTRTTALTLDQNQAATFASTVSATQLTSTIATGTAPFVVASTTQVANLNAATAGTAAGLSATLVVGSGGTGVTSVTATPTATSWAGWDANKNLSANNLLEGYTTTATAAGTTTLVVGSAYQQYFTGTTTQTVVLPVATTLANGQSFLITNLSTGVVTVNTSGSNAIQAMAANTQLLVTCVNTAGGTGTASWGWNYSSAQSTALPIAMGGTAKTAVSTAPAATSWAGWDANKNLSANNLLEGYTTTATAAGTTTLVVGSTFQQYFTGTTTQTVVLPVATTLVNGQQFLIANNSTGVVTVQTSGSNVLQAMGSNTTLMITCINTAGGTGTASWNWSYAPNTSYHLSPWQAGTTYALNQTVTYEKNAYICVTANTAGATFEADILLGYWAIINNPALGPNRMLVGNNFEDGDAGGWQIGTVTLSSLIPSGAPTLGTASSISLTATTTGAMDGVYSMSVANTASTNFTAGQGIFSQVYNIPTIDQAKVLAIQFAYQAYANVATTGMAFPGTSSNTWSVYIYDVTNSAWIQPAGVYNLVQGTGTAVSKGNTFQTASNATQFRLALICINSTTATTPAAGAMTLLLDDFYVGPQITANGPAMTDWTSFTPTGAFTGATFTGKYRRVGDSAEIDYYVAFTGASSGSIVLNPPTGLAIDTTKLAATAGVQQSFGTVSANKAGVGDVVGGVWLSGTGVSFAGPGPSAATWNFTGVPFTAANNDNLRVRILVPIVGWSSNTSMSADTDTRVVAAYGSITTTTVSTSYVQLNISATKDTSGAVVSNTIIAPVSGFYDFNGYISCGTTHAYVANYRYTLGYSVNNGTGPSAVIGEWRASASGTVQPTAIGASGTYLNAGDVLRFWGINDGGSDSTTGGFYISRRSGPATVQATESVNARYVTTNAQAITNTSTATINTWTKSYDSHSAMNATTGVFTVPVSGKYRITASLLSAQTSWTTSTIARCEIQVSGTQSSGLFLLPLMASQNNFLCLNGSTTLSYNAGDTISLSLLNNTGTTFTLQGSSTYNWITIERVGN